MKNRFALKPIRTTLTMRELVYEQLHNAIINGVFKPGDRLVERELANIVGVSKTPVREATRQLEQEGLVQIVPYKGIIVTELSFTQVKEVYDLRSLLDGFASYLAAKKATEEEIESLHDIATHFTKAVQEKNLEESFRLDVKFHDLISDASEHEFLKRLQSIVRAQSSLARGLSMPFHSDKTLEEHQAILEGIKNRNPELAREAAKKHVASVWKVAATRFKKANDLNNMID